LARIAQGLGVDVVDCSSGGNSPKQQVKEGPGYQVPFAERIKKEIPSLGIAAVGKITDAIQANEIVESGLHYLAR
jgi:2,4-dienoyl-CoA reductase-like NADH-dependent reductase (Old Yellow Enzyme family)